MTIGGKQLWLALSADQQRRARPSQAEWPCKDKAVPVPDVAEVRPPREGFMLRNYRSFITGAIAPGVSQVV